AAITMNGGTLSVRGSDTSSTNTTETIGNVTLGSAANTFGGTSTILLTTGSGGSLTVQSTGSNTLTRAAGSGAVLNVSDGASNPLGSTAQLKFGTAPPLTGSAQPSGTGILPYLTVNGGEFGSYTAANGIQAYSAANGGSTPYAPTASGAAAGANVLI